MRLFRATTVAAMLVLTGCSRAPVITIANHSSLTLSNIVVSGSGFSEQIGNIGPGGERTLTVYPRGESGLRVAFDAAGEHIDKGEQGYFEGGIGYRVQAIISTDLSVSVSSDLRSY